MCRFIVDIGGHCHTQFNNEYMRRYCTQFHSEYTGHCIVYFHRGYMGCCSAQFDSGHRGRCSCTFIVDLGCSIVYCLIVDIRGRSIA